MISSVASVSISDHNDHLDTPDARTRLGSQVAFFLSHGSPRVLVANAALLALVRAALGGFTLVDLAAWGAVALFWPAQEWALHRFALHRKPTRVWGVLVDPIVARKHREHHRRPWIVQTTLLPLPALAVLVPLQAAWWLVPDARLAATLAAAYAGWAVVYEWTHYLSHANWVPRSSFWRRIWKNHRLHHFKNENFWFAFTVPHIDTLLGTDPPDVDRSPTVRTLGVDADKDPS